MNINDLCVIFFDARDDDRTFYDLTDKSQDSIRKGLVAVLERAKYRELIEAAKIVCDNAHPCEERTFKKVYHGHLEDLAAIVKEVHPMPEEISKDAESSALTAEISEAYIANNGLTDSDKLWAYLISNGFTPDRGFTYRKEGDMYVFEQEVHS